MLVRPQNTAVAAHRTFRTSDPQRAHDHVEQAFAVHELGLQGKDQVRFQLDTAVTKGVTVGRMAYGARAQIVGPEMRDCYHINLLVSGHCSVAQNGRQATFSAGDDRAGVVFGPDAPVFIDWSADCAQYHMKLPRFVFEAHAAKLAGHATPSTIDFDLTFPLTSPAGKALYSSVAFYYSQLAVDGGLAAMPEVQLELESALMSQVLFVANSNLTPELTRDTPRHADTAIRSVMDYIETHAQGDLTIAGLARLSGTTARTLQIGFQRVAGVTPTEYIRNTRLDGAHRDLHSREGWSVSEVAHRWHFFHLGRFAQQYRHRFGESPSQTFRRQSL